MNRPHSYELTKLELIDEMPNSSTGAEESVSVASLSAAKLLKNVEKEYDPGVYIIPREENNAENESADAKNEVKNAADYVRFIVETSKSVSGLHSTFLTNVDLYSKENPIKVASVPSSGRAKLDFDAAQPVIRIWVHTDVDLVRGYFSLRRISGLSFTPDAAD